MLREEFMFPSASHAILEAENVVTRVAKRAPVRNMLWPRAREGKDDSEGRMRPAWASKGKNLSKLITTNTSHGTAVVELGNFRVSVCHNGAKAAACQSACSRVRKTKIATLEELRKRREEDYS
jgi:hypothetical protein